MSTPNYFAQISYRAYLAELNERLTPMNQTDQITLTDVSGQSAVYVPKEEAKLPENWLLALEFAKKVRAEIPKSINGSDDFPALVSLVIHLTH